MKRLAAVIVTAMLAGCQPRAGVVDPFMRPATVPPPGTGAAVPSGAPTPFYNGVPVNPQMVSPTPPISNQYTAPQVSMPTGATAAAPSVYRRGATPPANATPWNPGAWPVTFGAGPGTASVQGSGFGLPSFTTPTLPPPPNNPQGAPSQWQSTPGGGSFAPNRSVGVGGYSPPPAGATGSTIVPNRGPVRPPGSTELTELPPLRR